LRQTCVREWFDRRAYAQSVKKIHASFLTAVSGRNNFPSLMPIYEYRCTKCRKRFSVEQSISEHKRRPACPKCKSRAVEPMFSTFFAKTGRKS